MRNIAIIALLLACVSVAGNAGNRKEFDLMKQENMKMKAFLLLTEMIHIWQVVVSGVRNIS